jgi:hypothetical protein
MRAVSARTSAQSAEPVIEANASAESNQASKMR